MVQQLPYAVGDSNSQCACRSCGASGLATVLSLGSTPLANALLREDQLAEPEASYPLDLVLCPVCSLVQITETVPPEELFRDYAYFSSFSDTMLQHARRLTSELVTQRQLTPNSLVVEIASNDGYLLQYYQQVGVPVLGIEPARNIAKVAQDRGIRTVCEFFSRELADQLSIAGDQADVIHANNVLAHVADVNGFVGGIAGLLKEQGVAVIEAPYVKDLIDHVEFDTIYHEHLCYFSLTSLHHLFERHGLAIIDVQRVAIHGGTLRITAARRNVSQRQPVSPNVARMLAEEAAWGVKAFGFYGDFGTRVQKLRSDLLELMQGLKAEQKRIAVYGASAKGSTLLNYFGIGRDLVDYVVDRSTIKQGRFTPGTHLKIHSPDKLVEDVPDFTLLLTWNFAEEILEQQTEYRSRGGRFIVPIPHVRVA